MLNNEKQHSKEVLTTSSGGKEQPSFGNDTLREIILSKDPLPPPSPQVEVFRELRTFLGEVVVLLVTVIDAEIWAVLYYMTPPICSNGQPMYTSNRTINFYDPMLNAKLILGMFGGHKTALLQAKEGDDSHVQIENALQLLPNTLLVAGVGIAYGRNVCTLLGDVLVSTTIDGIGNVRWGNGQLDFQEGDNHYTPVEQRALEVFATEVDDWATTTGFKVTKSGRVPKIHADMIISMPWHINDLDILAKVIKNSPLAVGGEMEGQVIAGTHNDLLDLNPPKVIDVIIIKGVSNFADGNANTEWDLTGALAAAGYMKFKLEQTDGQVCKSYELSIDRWCASIYVQLRSIPIYYLHMQTGFQAPLRHLIQLLIMLLHPIIYLSKVLYNMSIVRKHYNNHHTRTHACSRTWLVMVVTRMRTLSYKYMNLLN